MDDISTMRPIDAFKAAQRAVDALHRMDYDSAFDTLGLDRAWLQDATLLEVVRIATARLNEFMDRAGLPRAAMRPNPDDI